MKLLATLVLTTTFIGAAPAHAGTVADWKMNEHHGTVLHDSAGHQDGTIGRRIRLNGESHLFTAIQRHHYQRGRIDKVPDSDRLDPGDARFSVTVQFKWPGNQDNNLIQKGQGSPAGGLFKMKTSVPLAGQPAGHIKCLFRGSTGDSQVESYGSARLDDNLWHHVTCTRTPTGTVMVVDGDVVDRNDNDPGAISNDWPVTIGGNTFCDRPDLECNYWHGRIGRVTWRVGS